MNRIVMILVICMFSSTAAAQSIRYVAYPARAAVDDIRGGDFVSVSKQPIQAILNFDLTHSAGDADGRFFEIDDLKCGGAADFDRCFSSPYGSLMLPQTTSEVKKSWSYGDYVFQHKRVDTIYFHEKKLMVDVIAQCKDHSAAGCITFIYNKEVGVVAIQYPSGMTYVLDGRRGLLARSLEPTR